MDKTITLADLTLLPVALPANYKNVIDGDDQKTIILPFKTLAYNLLHNKFTRKVLESGDRLGKYLIDDIIGEGSFSYVYGAHHIYLNQQVAIKILKTDSQVSTAIFLQEAQALALLSHNNVIQVIDADIWEELPFIALERLSGNNLNEVIKKYKNLSIERTMDLMEEIGSVLAKQEENGILHLDIKPDNIFQREDGRFCLYDYGLVGIISKSNGPEIDQGKKSPLVFYSTAFGTPAYMPPEQANGMADHRSDLFSFGMTIWECLVGQKSRTIRQVSEFKNSVLVPIEPISNRRKDVPVELELIINNLLEISPDDRYQSANDFLEDLYSFRYNKEKPFGGTIGTAFVAIPFSPDFQDIFYSIHSACKNNKLKSRRLDKHIFFNDIWSQCVQEIEVAKVVIADFTGINSKTIPNPNVITEAAHARAINKPLIIITQETPEDLPFDWRYFPVIKYEKSDEGLNKLEKELRNKLNYALKNATFSCKV